MRTRQKVRISEVPRNREPVGERAGPYHVTVSSAPTVPHVSGQWPPATARAFMTDTSSGVSANEDRTDVRNMKFIAQFRVAGGFLAIAFILFAVAFVFYSVPLASGQTTGGSGAAAQAIQSAGDGTATAPLLALTGACGALVTALGIVVRAFVKGDIAPRASTVREEELIKQGAALTRLLEDAARREDVFYRAIGLEKHAD